MAGERQLIGWVTLYKVPDGSVFNGYTWHTTWRFMTLTAADTNAVATDGKLFGATRPVTLNAFTQDVGVRSGTPLFRVKENVKRSAANMFDQNKVELDWNSSDPRHGGEAAIYLLEKTT